MTAAAEQQTDTGARLPADRVKAFVLAGRAVFTLRNAKTGAHLTYRVNQAKEGRNGHAPPHFVKIRTGTEYANLGTIFDDGIYRHGRRSTIAPTALSARTFDWFWARVRADRPLPADLQVWHEGACAACGRPLTDPRSISIGMGPICRGER